MDTGKDGDMSAISVIIPVYNVEEYDGYQVNYTYDGYFSYSFIVNMENCSDVRTFRVTV